MRTTLTLLPRLLAFAALACGITIAAASPSQAQTALCPAAVGAQAGIALANGTCTNGVTGAFSGAALSTQALSDLSQSATQETVRNTSSALQTRREQEQQRCPDGFSRVNGECVRNVPAATPIRPMPAPAATKVATSRAAPVSRRRVAPRPAVEPLPSLVAYPVYPPDLSIALRQLGDRLRQYRGPKCQRHYGDQLLPGRRRWRTSEYSDHH